MKIILLGPVLWDSMWGHAQELIKVISKKNNIIYLEPIVHSSKLRLSFQRTTENPIPENTIITERQTKLGLDPLYVIYTEIMNLIFLIKHDFEVFISYYTTCGFLSVLFSRLIGKKVILIYADDLAELYEPKIAKILTKHFFTPFVAKLSNYIIATSHKLKESIEKYNKNTKYIPNGVNTSFYSYKKIIDKQGFNIGFVGAFGDWIDFDMVLEAANTIKINKDIKFYLVGDGEEFNYINKKTKELNLDNIILTGAIAHSEIPEILAQMDVCIIPFKKNRLTDGVSPVKLFEYWAMEKPVISTSFYEIKKIARNKVIFADDSDELKNSILKLKNDDKLINDYGKIGFKEVIEKYDWKVLAKTYYELIPELN